MTKPHDFAVNLAKTGHSANKIIELTEQAFPGKGLKKTAVYDILKLVKEGKNTEDKRARTGTTSSGQKTLLRKCTTL